MGTWLKSENNIETLWFEVSQPCSKKILFGAVYRPPDTDATKFTASIEETLNFLSKGDTEMVLLGDFNFDFDTLTAATKTFGAQQIFLIWNN